MTSIVRYKKQQTEYTTITLVCPEIEEEGELGVTELATLDDGYTYVAIADGVKLPEQPKEIQVKPVRITNELCEKIKQGSPRVRFINQQVVRRIREQYKLDDEQAIMAQAVHSLMSNQPMSADKQAKFDAYIEHRNAAVGWGNEQKTALGLA